MYISEVHNEAIDEYIDSVLSKEGLIVPFINNELADKIKVLFKKIFLAGYEDCNKTPKITLENEK